MRLVLVYKKSPPIKIKRRKMILARITFCLMPLLLLNPKEREMKLDFVIVLFF
jgi:hypothetical protein